MPSISVSSSVRQAAPEAKPPLAALHLRQNPQPSPTNVTSPHPTPTGRPIHRPTCNYPHSPLCLLCMECSPVCLQNHSCGPRSKHWTRWSMGLHEYPTRGSQRIRGACPRVHIRHGVFIRFTAVVWPVIGGTQEEGDRGPTTPLQGSQSQGCDFRMLGRAGGSSSSWWRALACGLGSPELSKSYFDTAGKLLTFGNIPPCCRYSSCTSRDPWKRSSSPKRVSCLCRRLILCCCRRSVSDS